MLWGVLLGRNIIQNYVKNLFKNDVGIENCAILYKYLKVNQGIIFPKYFLLLEEHTIQEILITFLVLLPNKINFGILFSHQL